MDIVIHGATGRMGRAVAALEGQEGSAVVASVSPELVTDKSAAVYSALDEYEGPADCVVDFSNHAATAALLDYCTSRGLPVVIATTGQTPEERALIEAAAEKIAVFFSANMSLGVALVADLARRVAAALPDAEVEIVETHHDQKLDAPSGTALMLAHAVQEGREQARPGMESPIVQGRSGHGKRTREEIGVHSLRLGNVVGTHEVIVSTGAESITVRHEACDRALFAHGALRAAAFIADKGPGLYTMADIIES